MKLQLNISNIIHFKKGFIPFSSRLKQVHRTPYVLTFVMCLHVAENILSYFLFIKKFCIIIISFSLNFVLMAFQILWQIFGQVISILKTNVLKTATHTHTYTQMVHKTVSFPSEVFMMHCNH